MRIGVDLGGTKIEIIALDDDGATLARERLPTPVGNYEETIDTIAALVDWIEGRLGRRGSIGIGTPGAISAKTGLLKNSNSTILNGRPLDRDLASRLRRPIRLENDANCFALSEAVDGAGAEMQSVFSVIIGTGVGGGIVVDGRIRNGANRIAGEWGHNPLPWPADDERPGPPCYCGRSGCIETFLSGAGLTRTYQELSGQCAQGDMIARLARNGDANARSAVTFYQDRLARALATIINVLDPHAVVLGGGLSNLDELYDGLTQHVSCFCFSDSITTPILRPRHGDSSGVRGAAWLWPEGTEAHAEANAEHEC